jgi:hypothetical protein
LVFLEQVAMEEEWVVEEELAMEDSGSGVHKG